MPDKGFSALRLLSRDRRRKKPDAVPGVDDESMRMANEDDLAARPATTAAQPGAEGNVGEDIRQIGARMSALADNPSLPELQAIRDELDGLITQMRGSEAGIPGTRGPHPGMATDRYLEDISE